MAFHEVQFPTDISFGSAGGPQFNTEVIELGSAFEKRNQNWTYSRERWDVAYGIDTKTKLTALATFFYARRGKAHGFRFKNHDDYQATNQELGSGDGATTTFQLVKLYTSGGETYTRKITKPVTGTITVYLDSVEQTSTISVSTTTGIVTFDSAPSSGEIVTADFDFDIPVRFDTDHLPINFAQYEARAASVPIVEIRV